MDQRLREALTAVLDPAGLVVEADALVPATIAELCAALRVCAEHGTRLRAVSSRPGAAVPGTVVVSVARLTAVAVALDALVARAEAGATVAELRRAIESEGLALAAPAQTVAGGASHVGSLVARGGIARRGLTGMEVVTARGELVVVGGAMPKDVAPFDLAAAMLGSAGRLGVVVAVSLRLVPAAALAGMSVHEAAGTARTGALDARLRAAFDPDGALAPA